MVEQPELRGSKAWIGYLLIVVTSSLVFTLPFVFVWIGHKILLERRELLVTQLQTELATTSDSIAALVGERARDIQSDLFFAIDLLAQHAGETTDEGLSIIEPYLVALDRSKKHYLALWHIKNGDIICKASMSRPGQGPVPEVSQKILQEFVGETRNHPGMIVAIKPEVQKLSPYTRVRLFGIASQNDRGTIIVLVSMDALFDLLQRRANLPGVKLWVVDVDGTALVDPEDNSDRAEVLSHLTSEVAEGFSLLGEPPGIWPFSPETESRILVWRSRAKPPFRWATGLVAPLTTVAVEVQSLAVRIVFFSFLVFLAVAVFLLFLVWNARRQRHLRKVFESQALINRLRDQLIQSEKLSTLGQISAEVAHEVGNPLGVISIRLDQVLEKSVNPKDRRSLEIMKEQIGRITKIIRQLLDYSRPQTSDLREYSLHDVVHQVQELVSHRLQREGIVFTNAVPKTARVLADLNQLQQVLLNLVINACDACDKGDAVTLRVSQETRKGFEHCIGIVIADTGCGITTKKNETVFEPFVTSKKRGQGTGLGLTIVKDIVERQGGLVEVETGVELTLFTVWWPSGSSLEKRPPSMV